MIQKVLAANAKLKAFRRGIAFFSYNGKCLKDLENHYAPEGSKRKTPPKITRKDKIGMAKFCLAIYFLFTIVKTQLDKLGMEKS